MGAFSDLGTFVCEAESYQMKDDESVASISLNLISKGWRASSSELADEAKKLIAHWQLENDKLGKNISENTKDEIEQYKIMVDLANSIKTFGMVDTLY